MATSRHGTILVVDDEEIMREILETLLTREGYDVRVASSGTEGLEMARALPFDAAIVDIMMPGLDGIATLDELKRIDEDLAVIIITAYASVESAISAMKAGAFDYVTKPFKNDEVLVVVRNAMERRRLVNENRNLRQNIQERYHKFANIIGRSPRMRQVFDLIIQAAPSRSTILIQGESGTGKELVARAIHANSSRSERSFVCMDGVNSMTGNAPDLNEFARIARRYDAMLYVDDAHGFGVIGERSPEEPSPYGLRGNSVVKYCEESYDGIVLVGGFSKSYSSLAAFVACPPELKELLKTAAPPYLYSGPSPVASLATVLAGFDVNEARGEAIRTDLWRKTDDVLRCLDRLGIHTPNRSGFPIIEVPLARHEDIDAAGRFLFDHGIYVTLAAYPLVPKTEVGFRIQVTAANSRAEIEQLCDVLGKLANAFDLRPGHSQEYAA